VEYYVDGWREFIQDMELLPITYTSHFNDGTADKSYIIVAGNINHIHIEKAAPIGEPR
jgi:hypothetical protein